MVSLAYGWRNGFPFSTYGEGAFIAVQNIEIAVLVLHLSGRSGTAAGFVAGIATLGYALLDEKIVGMGLLKRFMGAGGAISVVSKLPQIYTVFKQGGTGQLSAFAVCFFFPLI